MYSLERFCIHKTKTEYYEKKHWREMKFFKIKKHDKLKGILEGKLGKLPKNN